MDYLCNRFDGAYKLMEIVEQIRLIFKHTQHLITSLYQDYIKFWKLSNWKPSTKTQWLLYQRIINSQIRNWCDDGLNLVNEIFTSDEL